MNSEPIACRRRDSCRLCGGKSLTLVFSLTPTPPANAFVEAFEIKTDQQAFPLDLFFCNQCTHLQLLDVVDPAALFENYVYVSGTSPVFVGHFKAYAEDIVKRHALAPGAFVLDIGSNDGTLLRFFKEAGMRVLGVDPAKKIAAEATKAGIDTIPGFFAPDLASKIRAKYGAADVVTANNVFAHADDLGAVLAGVRELLAPDGVFAFEVSYLGDVISKTLFDTIYHEHLSYHAVRPLIPFFKANGMELIEAWPVDTHGGSLRGVAKLSSSERPGSGSMGKLLALETGLMLEKPETYRAFAESIIAVKGELLDLVRRLRDDRKIIAGFGAPAKATTLMIHFDLGPRFIEFIVDDSPLKQGLFTPGFHIPVLAPEAIYERKPDYLVILAWNFAPSIMAKHKAFLASGGHFIVPLPKVQVI